MFKFYSLVLSFTCHLIHRSAHHHSVAFYSLNFGFILVILHSFSLFFCFWFSVFSVIIMYYALRSTLNYIQLACFSIFLVFCLVCLYIKIII